MKNVFPGSVVLASPHVIGRKRAQQVTTVWTNPGRSTAGLYSSIFVMALTQNAAARGMVETALAEVARTRGLRAARSIDVCPTLLGEDGPTRHELWGNIRDLGCDAIYTVSLLDVKSEQRYLSGLDGYAPYPQRDFYGTFGSYCEHVEPIITVPGYYVTEKTYFLEGNVFDAATGQIQWSMQSIAYNPSELDCFSKEYALLFIDQLNKPYEAPS